MALGAAVGSGGQVLGVDLSAAMLNRAVELAQAAGAAHVEFRRVDAQSASLGEGSFDLVFSRFGVMFFADPTTAFANLRAALRRGGRLVFVCWQPPSANLWAALPNRAALRFFDLEAPPHDAPGPFSLAGPDRIRTVLTDAGFAEIEITPEVQTLALGVGHGVDNWVHERLLMGLAHDRYVDSAPAVQEQARQALIASVAGYQTADGLEMTGSAWIVSAR